MPACPRGLEFRKQPLWLLELPDVLRHGSSPPEAGTTVEAPVSGETGSGSGRPFIENRRLLCLLSLLIPGAHDRVSIVTVKPHDFEVSLTWCYREAKAQRG